MTVTPRPSRDEANNLHPARATRRSAAVAAGVFFVTRLKDNAAFTVEAEFAVPENRNICAEDNLVCVVKRKFVVTTDSAHGLKVYPNRAASMTLTGVDQLWIADITYIRLEEEFVYLAVILDAYSRRVIGWHLGEGLDGSLTLTPNRQRPT
jgi:hypothetical protein